MAEQQLDRGSVAFQTEGRLLQELGERLVASPQVALVELVKNAYDADATHCDVSIRDAGRTLVIRDDGSGMSFQQFADRWMRIATSRKVEERSSPKFRRRLTGQKGIGRFAVRFLGKRLHLDSVAWDHAKNCMTRLLADFDWAALDKVENLERAEIPYRLFRVEEGIASGTTLEIGDLKDRSEFATSPAFRTAVLKITSPLTALDGGKFRTVIAAGARDRGFRITLPGEGDGSSDEVDLAERVLDHAWAKLKIELSEKALTYEVSISGEKQPERLRIGGGSAIRHGAVADIRFFPRRAGIFKGAEVSGPQAWRWVRDNHGIAVVDHGFRVPPYGFVDDDWLKLDIDGAHNERNWRSSISKETFPIPDVVRPRAENPMLGLPSNFQLVGGVFVESTATGSRSELDLITSMDREGFVENEAFLRLTDIVRGGIEFLALQDREWKDREAARKAKDVARRTRADLRAAVSFIEQSPTLTKADKSRLVQEYSDLASKVSEVESYDREARRRLETMSALGIVAGFMTHEASRIVASLGDALKELTRLARKHPSIKSNVAEIEQSYHALESHLAYARTFIDATQKGEVAKFKAAAQVRVIIERFGEFARARGISVGEEIDKNLEAPRMPVAVYSGILLNLYTNALKAILATPSSRSVQKILFRAENDSKWHVVEVLDTGVGIPDSLRERIWDPLFTTSSRLNNPLGSGMGLGLSLVRQLVEQIGGKANVVDAPPGFTTCFRVQLPLN